MNELEQFDDWKLAQELRNLLREEEEKIMGKATFWLVVAVATLFVFLKLGSRQA